MLVLARTNSLPMLLFGLALAALLALELMAIWRPSGPAEDE